MKRILLITATAVLATSPAQAKGLKWMDAPPGLPSGAKVAVVKGDPSKAGDFTIQIKMPAGYTVAPHHHPGDETVRVLGAGTLNYGMGDKLDKANAASLTKGYHVTMQAGMNHWVFTNDPVQIQVSGKGPFQIVYVDPKDDPRTAK
jgi:quercetin dioxygenase-like cupin family protein